MLLLHAGVADRSIWDEHLDWLAADGFRAIAVDLPGFGEAEVRGGVQAPWEDVLETLRALEAPRATIVGNSFGAAVALRVAVVAPATVRALMLVSPPPLSGDPSPALAAAWEAEETALEAGDVDGAVDAVVNAWLLPSAPDELRVRVAAMQRRAFELQSPGPDVSEAPDPLDQRPEALASLQMPVLAGAGEFDLPDFVAGAREIVELVRDGRYVGFAGAGHLAPLETPDRFRDVLADFLREPLRLPT